MLKIYTSKQNITCFLLFFVLSINSTYSQNEILWEKQPQSRTSSITSNKKNLPQKNIYTVNIEAMRQQLANAPLRGNFNGHSNLIISFPNSEGEMERFRIFEAPVLHPDLAARYPGIKSYAGQGVEDSSARLRFSISPSGMQTMRLSADKPATFIDQFERNGQYYSVYKRADRTSGFSDFECEVKNAADKKIAGAGNSAMKNADDAILRTYRLAMSATGEFTQYHGGTKALALAAINTTMTRVNGIYESDFNVTMILIANTDDVIYTSTSSDPYGSTTSGYNSALQSTLTSVIGESNYDIGHLVANLQNNGNAGCIGCVCVNNQKGSGWTSHTVPEGDNFDVDYVAHEIGHQFGGNHTFTHGNEGTGVQMEPGSGSTIMGYAGITGATDVQAHSDPYFHAVTIEQITDYIKSTSCQTNTSTGNAVPTASAGANYTIPKGTPFVLDGSASDADSGDVLTHCWEQMNSGSPSTTYPSVNNTSGTAFRSFNPTTDTKRYFPRLSTVKTGATSWQWEAVPNVARTLNFRYTVRDNVAGGGNNNSDDTVISVNGTAGPFVVNSPNTSVIWNVDSFATITWDVAGTTGNGINAANVDIFLSTDGGDTYPITLASAVANDGSHDIVVPNNQGTQNRVMVRGTGNIFFDISDTDFTIAAPIVCNATVPTSFATSSVGSTTATLSWDAITSVVFDIQYREVGSSSWTDVSTSNTTFDLTGLTPETDYEAQIRSRCPDDSTSAYTSPTITFTTTAIPPCVGTQITSYPYLENFDSGIGEWSQASGDDGNWILDANGTPSGGTGPSDDIAGGGNYFYIEASDNGTTGEIGADATAILESPCFDLSSLTEAYFLFYYHMYGANTGTLEVEITNDNGVTWTNIFTAGGDLGDVWNAQNINLSTYLNQTVKLRFIGTTGNGFASDIAIDHISITDDPIYCDSNGNSTADEYINRVQLETIDNNNSGAGTTSTGYSDFTAQSTVLYGGQPYTITITPEWTGTVYNEGYSVWIDYNNNGSFDDAGEQVFTESPTIAASVSGEFTVPLDVAYGTTRMRVSLMWNAIPNSCGSFGYGEVEDYTIDLQYDGLLFTDDTWTPNAPSGATGSHNALVLDGTFNLTSDIAINDLIVNTGATLEVDPSQTITINGDISANGNLVLNSNPTGYSSLLFNGTLTGDVKYKRHVNAFNGTTGNDLIASPLTGQNFGDFAFDNTNIFENPGDLTQKLFGPFNKTTDSYQLYDSVDDASVVLESGIGYRGARDASKDGTHGTTFTFTGGVNTGNVDATIVTQGTVYDIWNLIGNPYPSYIKLEDFLLANNSKFDTQSAGIYGYDGDASNGWTVWNQAYSDANLNSVITPGQGFFVASKTLEETVNFTPIMRSSGTSGDFIIERNSTSSDISYLKLKLTGNVDSYSTEFYITDNASIGLDVGYDAKVFGGTAAEFSIYSHLVSESQGVDMAVQSISNADIINNVSVPIGINATQGQQLALSIDATTLGSNIDVYIEDNLSNTFTLLNNSDFVFTPNTNLNGIGRFYLRFQPETLSNEEYELDRLQIYNTSFPDLIHVNGILTNNYKLSLYDIHGRIIISKDLKLYKSSQQIEVPSVSKGVYLVQIKNNSRTINKKIIIK